MGVACGVWSDFQGARLMQTVMKDWPLRLRLNAAACDLAKALHDAARDAYGPASATFENQPSSAKDDYILAASNILHAVRPTDGTRYQVNNVAATLARQSMRVVR